MSTNNDGGPAFPRQHAIVDANDAAFKLGHPGMTLLDWFAGQSLAGLRARDLEGAGERNQNMNMHHNHADVRSMDNVSSRLARIAYEDAAAMIAGRPK